jgi:uncharacterized membrane protein YtjA (UPF0391 family)
MLKRAAISVGAALIAAIWGFSGYFPVTGIAGQALFFAAVGLLLLSLLFSLFEDTPAVSSDELVSEDFSTQPLPLPAEARHANV